MEREQSGLGNAAQGDQVPFNSMSFLRKSALVDKTVAACKQNVLLFVLKFLDLFIFCLDVMNGKVKREKGKEIKC